MSPSTAPRTADEWARALRADPDALAGLLRALVASGDPVEATAEGLHQLVSPWVSYEPFPTALRAVARPSLRAVHKRCEGLSWPQFGRLARGEREPELPDLVTVAAACKVPPSYFAEYRRLMVLSAVSDLMARSKRADLTLYRAIGRQVRG